MTTPMNDRSKVIERIQKLQALAERGGSVDEGIAAAMKVIELMERYSIAQEELNAASAEEAQPVTIRVEIPDPVAHNLLLACLLSDGLKTFKVSVTGKEASKKLGTTFLFFMAMSKEEAEAAVSLWSILVALREGNLRRDYRRAYKAGHYTSGFKTSFRNGFSSAIDNLVHFQESQRTQADSTALVHIGARLEKAHLDMTKGGTRNIPSRESHNYEGYRKGVERGNEAGAQTINKKTQLPG